MVRCHSPGDRRPALPARPAGVGAGLERFLRATIEGRERSKFIFTRHLSQALDDLAAFALQHGCTREQLSHMDIHDLLQIDNGMSSGEIAAFIAARAGEGRRAHHVALCTQLPSLVFERRDLRVFERFRSQPNFVTSKRVVASLVELSGISEVESGGSPSAAGWCSCRGPTRATTGCSVTRSRA